MHVVLTPAAVHLRLSALSCETVIHCMAVSLNLHCRVIHIRAFCHTMYDECSNYSLHSRVCTLHALRHPYAPRKNCLLPEAVLLSYDLCHCSYGVFGGGYRRFAWNHHVYQLTSHAEGGGHAAGSGKGNSIYLP